MTHPEDPASGCRRLDALPGRDLPGGLRLAEAAGRRARLTGLARLDAMPARYALRIPRCRSVHTFTMRFALDLVWLDAAGRPLRIDEGVAPRRFRTCLGASAVVEANAGCGQRFAAALRGGG